MNYIVHYATCPCWETGDFDDCSCFLPAAWRIRKEPSEQFPWRIWRRTADWTYEPLMRCSSWRGAMELVGQFIWLRQHAVQRIREANDV